MTSLITIDSLRTVNLLHPAAEELVLQLLQLHDFLLSQNLLLSYVAEHVEELKVVLAGVVANVEDLLRIPYHFEEVHFHEGLHVEVPHVVEQVASLLKVHLHSVLLPLSLLLKEFLLDLGARFFDSSLTQRIHSNAELLLPVICGFIALAHESNPVLGELEDLVYHEGVFLRLLGLR
eukprot:CAMPEP_0168619484 /NCGR_PEP_ID=MMETSP0449_2-20121227/6625_1 /TAXON_ID=1082188 /ORGANISM="Strombidium rassoulzadegani, Strain ras09" /LENGTH=176 /DNA_ID=CAMNT_0008660419 /DNA_START=188 /DNA_END=718 /DNA_ORIENTATION=+